MLAGFAVMAIEYGALGLLLGVLVKGDLEGFFLIIMGGLVDTFLQNPVGNPVANKPLLAYFPSFRPMQVASGDVFGHTWLAGEVALDVAWAAGFALLALAVFRVRTLTRRHSTTEPHSATSTAGWSIGDGEADPDRGVALRHDQR